MYEITHTGQKLPGEINAFNKPKYKMIITEAQVLPLFHTPLKHVLGTRVDSYSKFRIHISNKITIEN